MKSEILAAFSEDNDRGGVTRRHLFMGLGFGALAVTAAGSSVVFLQFLEPNVLFEPPTKYKVGIPEDYPVNSVVSHPDIRVLVVRTARGFVALSSVCTHLGCIARWQEQERLIFCPCHGSRFGMNGEVISGPAPSPLRHLTISLEQDGQLIVDTGATADPEFYLRV